MKVFSRTPRLFNETFFPARTEFTLEAIEDNDAFISWKNKDYNQAGTFVLQRDTESYRRFLTL